MAIYALFFANCRQYVLLEERPLYVSVDARGGGGATESDNSVLTFFPVDSLSGFLKVSVNESTATMVSFRGAIASKKGPKSYEKPTSFSK